MGSEMLYDLRDLRASVCIGEVPITPQDSGGDDVLWVCAASALCGQNVAIKLKHTPPSADISDDFFWIFPGSEEVHVDSLDAPAGEYIISFSLCYGFKYPHNVFTLARFNRRGELLVVEIGLAAANSGIYIVGREIFCGQALYAPHPTRGWQMPKAVSAALGENWQAVFRRMRASAKSEDLPKYEEVQMPPPLPLNGLLPKHGMVRMWNPANMSGRVETREWGFVYAHASDLRVESGASRFPCLQEGDIVSIQAVEERPNMRNFRFRARGIALVQRNT